MSKRKEPKMLTISEQAFYDRVAWLVWHGAYQEANALRELAAWFQPPMRIDESRIERRVAKYRANSEHISDPANWL